MENNNHKSKNSRENEEDLNNKAPKNDKNGVDNMVKVRGHIRKISRYKKVRVRAHKRYIPKKRYTAGTATNVVFRTDFGGFVRRRKKGVR